MSQFIGGVILRKLNAKIEALYEDGKLILDQPLSLPQKTRVLISIETDEEREERLRVSEAALLRTWDNPEDDIFNELLAK